MDQGGNYTSFLTRLKQELDFNGYFTPEISQFVAELEREQGVSVDKITQRAITFSQDNKNPLQSLFVVMFLLANFNLPSQAITTICQNLTSLLRNYYYNQKSLSLNEYDLNTRMQAWSLLTTIFSKLDEGLKTQIKQLAEYVKAMPEEDEVLKNEFLSKL